MRQRPLITGLGIVFVLRQKRLVKAEPGGQQILILRAQLAVGRESLLHFEKQRVELSYRSQQVRIGRIKGAPVPRWFPVQPAIRSTSRLP